MANDDAIPKELKEKLARFDSNLSDLESTLNPLLNTSRAEIEKLDPIDAAKADLVAAYALNSLFWMHLNVCGTNPKEHGIRQELGRIQSYMGRVKEIEDKKKAPKLDKGVAKRYVRSALWQAAQKKQELEDSADISTSSSSPSPGSSKQNSKGRKRSLR